MRVEMVMPQMGESITEGTVVRWTKQVGEMVAKDENVLDISTDKVDSEIPSPAAGKLVEIRAKEGETIPVGQVIAVIETEAGAAATPAAPAAAAPAPAPAPASVPASAPAPAPAPVGPPASVSKAAAAAAAALAAFDAKQAAPSPVMAPAPAAAHDPVAPVPPAPAPAPASPSPQAPAGPIPRRDGDRFYSPLVRAIARTEGISAAELASLQGTGRGGRVTREDLTAYVAAKTGQPVAARSAAPAPAAAAQLAAAPLAAAPSAPAAPVPDPTAVPAPPLPGVGAALPTFTAVVGSAAVFESIPGVNVVGLAAGTAVAFRPYPVYTAAETRSTPEGPIEVVKMDTMRQRIAEHMVRSKQTSPHVASVTEVDMTPIVRFREANKREFEAKHGVKLTYTPFIVAAAVRALLDYPMMNASVDGTDLLVRRYVNIGVAVALDNGLIVPVVKHAEEKNFLGIARAISDLASRARTKKLVPDDVAGGTFAVTNMGSFGNLFGIPIINQPNVGILGAGAIVKRPVVVGDAIAIRDIMYLSLSYDHRIVDGALGGYFIQRVRHYLERVDLAGGV